MRFVLYDDETLEPITVVNISGFGERDIERHGRRYRVPVPPKMTLPTWREEAPDNQPVMMDIVEIWFERFARGDQRAWMAFTRATDLAMLLTPDWLPGQRPTIAELREREAGLMKLLDMVLSER